MVQERRRLARKNFTYYIRIYDEVTGDLVGHLVDISTGGFKLESTKPVALRVDTKLRIDQLGELSNKNYLTFIGRANWCQPDMYDSTIFNVGFQIVQMSPGDYEVFVQMFNKYGMKKSAHQKNNSDYMPR